MLSIGINDLHKQFIFSSSKKLKICFKNTIDLFLINYIYGCYRDCYITHDWFYSEYSFKYDLKFL